MLGWSTNFLMPLPDLLMCCWDHLQFVSATGRPRALHAVGPATQWDKLVGIFQAGRQVLHCVQIVFFLMLIMVTGLSFVWLFAYLICSSTLFLWCEIF